MRVVAGHGKLQLAAMYINTCGGSSDVIMSRRRRQWREAAARRPALLFWRHAGNPLNSVINWPIRVACSAYDGRGLISACASRHANLTALA